MPRETTVAIIGGGPAGSTLAALLARRGHDVVVLDRAHHPREHVGESLVPSTNRVLQELGLLERMDELGFVRKPGASWTSFRGQVGSELLITYRDAPQPGIDQDWAYHVDRARFDELLLDNAAELGADVREGANAIEVLFDDRGRATGVVVRVGDREEVLRARVVVDASGRRCLLGKQLALYERDPVFNQFAVYSWFTGVRPPTSKTWNYIHVHLLPVERGWIWQIPITDRITSVGVVVDRQVFTATGTESGSGAQFDALVATSVNARHAMRDAQRIRPFSIEGDYSYRMRSFAGDGWMLIGDAARFVDPIFSSGVSVAMQSARFAVEAIDTSMRGDDERAAFDTYERRVQAGVAIWYEWICMYYRLQFLFPLFGRNPEDLLQMQHLLQGEVFDRTSVDVLDRMREALRTIEENEGHLLARHVAHSVPIP